MPKEIPKEKNSKNDTDDIIVLDDKKGDDFDLGRDDLDLDNDNDDSDFDDNFDSDDGGD